MVDFHLVWAFDFPRESTRKAIYIGGIENLGGGEKSIEDTCGVYQESV